MHTSGLLHSIMSIVMTLAMADALVNDVHSLLFVVCLLIGHISLIIFFREWLSKRRPPF